MFFTSEIQTRRTFAEYAIRHDIASCLIGSQAGVIRRLLEGYGTIMKIGLQREFRSVTIYRPEGENRTLAEAVTIVGRLVENQLLLHEVLKFID